MLMTQGGCQESLHTVLNFGNIGPSEPLAISCPANTHVVHPDVGPAACVRIKVAICPAGYHLTTIFSDTAAKACVADTPSCNNDPTQVQVQDEHGNPICITREQAEPPLICDDEADGYLRVQTSRFEESEVCARACSSLHPCAPPSQCPDGYHDWQILAGDRVCVPDNRDWSHPAASNDTGTSIFDAEGHLIGACGSSGPCVPK
jgi:hypothetical protein